MRAFQSCPGRYADAADVFGHAWALVFAAAMSITVNRAPTTAGAKEPLQRMVKSVKQGTIGTFIPFDPQGQPAQMGGPGLPQGSEGARPHRMNTGKIAA